MRRNHRLLPGLAALLTIFLAVAPAHAEDAGKAAKEQARRMQQQLRKAEQDKAQLTQEKGELEAQVKAAEEKLADLQRKADAATRRAASLSRELDSVKTTLGNKLADSERRLAETTQSLRQIEDDKRLLVADVTRSKQETAVCVEKNGKLHAAGRDLLREYQKKSCSDALLQGEPLTGLKQVQIENFLDEQRDKLDEQKLEAGARP